MIFSEAMMLTGVGLVVGLIVGAAISYYFQMVGINFGEAAADMYAEFGMSSIIYPELSWWLAGRTSFAVFIIAAFVAVYPAYKVTKLIPVDAIRSI